MNKLIIVLISFSIMSCATSNNEALLEGIWTNCSSSAGTVGGFVYTELKISKATFQSTLYGSLDNQCINIERPPEASVITTSGKYDLYNRHISSSGLNVYDLDFFGTTKETNLGIFPDPDFYTIILTAEERLYFGKLSKENNGSTEYNRPSEINYEQSFTKM